MARAAPGVCRNEIKNTGTAVQTDPNQVSDEVPFGHRSSISLVCHHGEMTIAAPTHLSAADGELTLHRISQRCLVETLGGRHITSSRVDAGNPAANDSHGHIHGQDLKISLRE